MGHVDAAPPTCGAGGMTWQPGQSGNPAGRPKADGGRSELREAIRQHVPAIILKLVELAKAGDVFAARTLMERVLPPLRPEAAMVALPDLAAASSLTAQGAVLVRAVANGELAPDVASKLLSGLMQAAHITKIDELERRLLELEHKDLV